MKKIEISVNELNKLLKAYRTLDDFLRQYIDLHYLYKEEFIKGMEDALQEVRFKKITPKVCKKRHGKLQKYCS